MQSYEIYFEYPNLASTSLLISIRGEANIMSADEARSKIHWNPR